MAANSNLPRVSVVIPTHNPRSDYLARVVDALREQTLSKDLWELGIVDNGSRVPLRAARPKDQKTKRQKDSDTEQTIDLSWHPQARIVSEERVGLTNARLRGFAETTGEIIVLVDDDNVLALDYLEQVVRIAREYPFLGAWSGNVTLELDPGVPEPPRELRHLLCERIVEQDLWSNDRSHFRATPWGAGECIRREVARIYTENVERDPRRRQLDLQGGQLVYGGDTDIVYAGLERGWGMGVFGGLKVKHLTPASRCRDEYFLRRYEGKAFSEVLHGWISTGAVPRTRRTDLRGRIGECFRWLFAGRMERKLMAARRRGLRRAEEFVRGQRSDV
jgi:glycosyltransferase involved in cell wall biosynthesis